LSIILLELIFESRSTSLIQIKSIDHCAVIAYRRGVESALTIFNLINGLTRCIVLNRTRLNQLVMTIETDNFCTSGPVLLSKFWLALILHYEHCFVGIDD